MVVTIPDYQTVMLPPGDVISTGTPGAVEIRDGDMLSCLIDGFEALSNPVVRRR
jgi:2-keto-4-pentenoate hydratase/2-oxohepta-3-ene-1,7-dioic acid hydratase in catechol pathway